jgi:hypothetical protein
MIGPPATFGALPAPGQIGFVSPDRPARVRGGRPQGGRPAVGLRSIRNPKLKNWLCFARWAHGRPLLQASNSALQTSPIYTPLPITRRVAGICTRKWIAPPSEIAVSRWPDANKENLCGGPFLVLDCCRNKNITGISARARFCLTEGGHWRYKLFKRSVMNMC